MNNTYPATIKVSNLPVYLHVASLIIMLITALGSFFVVPWLTYVFVGIGMALVITAWIMARDQRNSVLCVLFEQQRGAIKEIAIIFHKDDHY